MTKVRVRVAISVDQTGDWCAYGYSKMDERTAHSTFTIDNLEPGELRYWLIAELDVPEPREVGAYIQVAASSGD